MHPLVCRNLVLMFEREANVVEAIHETVAAELFHFKLEFQAVVVCDRALFQMHMKHIFGVLRMALE
jgi:hypothetical protein